MTHFIPLHKLSSAKGKADLLLNHVFWLHGLSIDIVSDRGPQFTARFWKEFCRLLRISVSLSSGFHPQTNGQTERLNEELETGLRLLCSRDPTSWSQNVVWVEYAHNSLPSSATGLTPFQVVYGHQRHLFDVQERECSVLSAQASALCCHLVWQRS